MSSTRQISIALVAILAASSLACDGAELRSGQALAASSEIPEMPPPLPPHDCDVDVLPGDLVGLHDQNGDGSLDRAELAALDQATRGRLPSFAGPPPFPHPLTPELEPAYLQHLHRVMWIYDADDSGALDAAEQALLRAEHRTGCRQHATRALARFDTNGDGALDAAELAVARTRREEGPGESCAPGPAAVSPDDLGPAERAVLRAQIRQAIVQGCPAGPPPPAAR